MRSLIRSRHESERRSCSRCLSCHCLSLLFSLSYALLNPGILAEPPATLDGSHAVRLTQVPTGLHGAADGKDHQQQPYSVVFERICTGILKRIVTTEKHGVFESEVKHSERTECLIDLTMYHNKSLVAEAFQLLQRYHSQREEVLGCWKSLHFIVDLEDADTMKHIQSQLKLFRLRTENLDMALNTWRVQRARGWNTYPTRIAKLLERLWNQRDTCAEIPTSMFAALAAIITTPTRMNSSLIAGSSSGLAKLRLGQSTHET